MATPATLPEPVRALQAPPGRADSSAMTQTAESGHLEQLSPRDLGRQLRAVRRARGLSRSDVARSAGLTSRELAAFERGRAVMSDNDLWCLAGSCGVEIAELLPSRGPLTIAGDLSSLTMGNNTRTGIGGPDGLLRDYLAMITELRNLAPGSRVPLREPDLVALADALGGNPESIEARLHELTGASREEAARLRAMILPPLALPSAFGSVADAAPLLDPADDFWGAQHATDLPGGLGDLLGPDPSMHAPAPAGDSSPADYALPPEDHFVPDAAPAAADLTLTADLDAAGEPTPPGEAVATSPAWLDADDTWTAGPLDQLPPPGGTPVDPFAAPEPLATGWGTAFDARPGQDDPSLLHLEDGPRFADANAGSPVLTLDDLFLGLGHRADPGALTGPPDEAPPLAGASGFALGARDAEPSWGPSWDSGVQEPSASFSLLAVAAAEALAEGAPDLDPPDPQWSTDDGPDSVSPLEAFDPAAADLDLLPTFEPRPDAPLDVAALPEPATSPALEELLPPIAWSADPVPVDTLPVEGGEQVEPEDAPPPGAPAPAVTFEAASSQWEVGGTFPATSVGDDGALSLRRAEFRWALADLVGPEDLVVEADVDFGAGAGFGLLFRAATDPDGRLSGYSFDVDPIYTGGSFLVRQWDENRQHWKPIAHVPVDDPTRLYGRHVVAITVRGERLDARVDGEPVLEVPSLARASLDLGRGPCTGARVGIQAWSTTDVTVEELRVGRFS